MPIVFRLDGFEVVILLPPREHGPAHVHVTKAGAPTEWKRIDG